MKKLIIFDLDGTLVDTLDDLTNAVNYALGHHSFSLKTKEHIRISIGNGVQTLIARCLPDGFDNPEYQNVLNTFIEYYAIHSEDNTKPYKGILDLIINLKSHHYKLAVCTNKVNDIANKLIRKTFGDLFDIIQGDQLGLKKKPEPDMINKILYDLGIDKSEAIYIGDTNVDMQTATNCNLDYYLITYGYRTKDELLIQCPNSPIVDSLEELYEMLKKQSV